MTTTLEDIRPVEALWLLDEKGEQNWTTEAALQAALIDLSVRGFVKPDPDNEDELQPTGEATEDDLRRYEQELLTAILGDDDQQAMVDAIQDFDFESFFYDLGLFEDEETEHSTLWGLLEWSESTRVWTDTAETLFDELQTAGSELERAVEREQVSPEQMPLIYAFPDAQFCEEFMDRSDDIVVDLEQHDTTAATGGAAAAGAAAAVSASTAASCASAAASCSAGAAGAAGGGAAGGAAGGGGAGGV